MIETAELNTDRLEQLADHLEAVGDQHFYMGVWADGDPRMYQDVMPMTGDLVKDIHQCGTRACVAGHAVLRFRPEDSGNVPDVIDENDYDAIANEAAHYLGLTQQQADELFIPITGNDLRDAVHGRLADLTVEDAAWTLRHLADTGNVVWKPWCSCSMCDPDAETDEEE